MSESSFSCVLLGGDTLLMECGDVLLDRGHDVRGVVTRAPRVVAWARRSGLDVIDAGGDWAARLRAEPFDHLFAITHLAIIPDEVLGLPRGMGINFHDGPLPRYAGLNAPVWALLAGEERYGVTWHELTSGVDTGDILARVDFDIADDETALSLNTKCMAAALESFPALVDALADGSVTRTPQDAGGRTYFGRHDRPTPACLIDWTGTTGDVLRFIRALSFGAYPNPLGIPKTIGAEGGAVVLVDAAEDAGSVEGGDSPGKAEGSTGEAAPGTVIEVGEAGVRVATADGSVRLVAGRGVDARAIAGSGWSGAGFTAGMRLATPGTPLFEASAELSDEIARAERFWERRLRQAETPGIPQAREPAAATPPAWASVEVPLPEDAGSAEAESKRTAAADAGIGRAAAAWAVYLARTGRSEAFALEVPVVDVSAETPEAGAAAGLYAETVPLLIDLSGGAAGEAPSSRGVATLGDVASAIVRDLEAIRARASFWRDLPLRYPDLARRVGGVGAFRSAGLSLGRGAPVGRGAGGPGGGGPDGGGAVGVGPGAGGGAGVVSLDVRADGSGADLHYDRTRVSDADALTIAECIARLAFADPSTPWTSAPLLAPKERERILDEWNDTAREWPRDRCIHELFEAQVDRTPERRAVVFGGDALTYRELDERANALAARLIEAGARPGDRVGVHVTRSLDLVVATLGVLKAGAAYLPLDADFPADRLRLMVSDSRAGIIVTQATLVDALPETSADVVVMDAGRGDVDPGGGRIDSDAGRSPERPGRIAESDDLAYVIYTSGSTGTPKGVLVEHRNVANFFAGMDDVVPHEPTGDGVRHGVRDGGPGVWLAVTSLSFDISVLELFWTLARGFTVVVYDDLRSEGHERAGAQEAARRPIDFGLFMWGNDDGPGPAKYRLMMEGARYFDEHGFHSVWTPERHFHAFGGPFPNPSVTGAAIAAVTERVAIRSGSCVSPLHHPVRIAEEWSVVDNLSDGRVGLAFASGWQPNDFILRPENHGRQKEVMFEQIDQVRRLWRGETLEFESPGGGTAAIRTLPRPVQEELPFWITTAGNPETYARAGALGANVLTHLLGQSLDEVAEKIRIYRDARAEAGLDRDAGQVTLMLHTFVGEDDDRVREIVRQPMKDYLGASMKLVLGFAWTFPAFKRPGQPGAAPRDIDLDDLSEEESDAILEFAFERYYETSGLFGTPDTCIEMVDRCKAIGVDEIACLLDFGVDTDAVMDSLPLLKRVKDATARPVAETHPPRATFAEQISTHGVTHLQCTPSMARLILADGDARPGLQRLQHLMIGGEAFPVPLADELATLVDGTITNMYGPTEATIWSSTHRVVPGEDPIPIGRPIANTRLYVLDRYLEPVPPGIPGELCIGGEGVARGYHDRPELTSERFVPDPFVAGAGSAGSGAVRAGAAAPDSVLAGGGHDSPRMYRTGDLARFRADGVLEFLGRVDRQVKFRGYRIELGEVEAALDAVDGVATSAVLLREDRAEAPWLVAYFVATEGEGVSDGGAGVDEDSLRAHLRRRLPEYMVPSRVVRLDAMPLTPNGKIDRRALPAPGGDVSAGAGAGAEPDSDLGKTIADCWREVLRIERVGVDDNFFDIGGHSLLVVQLHRLLTDRIDRAVSLVDLYRFPTIRRLVDHFDEETGDTGLEDSIDRAKRRREALSRRRTRG